MGGGEGGGEPEGKANKGNIKTCILVLLHSKRMFKLFMYFISVR